MTDFKALLAELTLGNVSIETVKSWVGDALAEGLADTETLLTQLQTMADRLPPEMVTALRETIATGSSGGAAAGDAPLEFDFDISIPEPPSDDDRTVVDPAARASYSGELALEPLTDSENAPAANDKTQVMPKESPAAENTDKTQVVAREEDPDKTQLGDNTDATVVSTGAPTDNDNTYDPFALDSTSPAAVSTPTGTGWPTTSGFTGGRGSGLDPRNIGPGTILKERFELLSAIGEGGMGMVYKARDLLKVEAKDRNPYIAVKLLSGDFREHPEAFIALQRESSKAQKLAHPNITTVYDFDRDGATVYLTMELMEGEELARYIKKLPAGGLPADQALTIIKQLCDGLEYAHARNLVHSDFKPGNCFFLKDGTVKILDFGIARASKTRQDAAGETTVFDPGQLGALTPAYATPEMFEGMPSDPRDDIYALACVAYELLAGKHPFNKLSSVKAMEKGLAPAPLSNKPGFTKRQQKALFKALAFRRDDRTLSVTEFWEGLRFKKNYLPYYIAAGLGGALLIGALAYNPIVTMLENRKNAEIMTSLQQGTAQVPDVLGNLDQLSERAQAGLLESAKDIVIGYYQQRAEALVNESQGKYDFPAAFAEIAKLREFYSDSAQVQTLQTGLETRQATLIATLTNDFNTYLEEDRLMPLENEDDITDVLGKLRQADPDNALLHDARLSNRYAQLAETAVATNAWDRAAEYLTVGLNYAADDAQLLNLNDQVSRELKRQADAKEVADIKSRLSARDGELNTVEAYAVVVADLGRLAELRPDDAMLADILEPLRTTVSGRIVELAQAGEFARAEELLFAFAQMFATTSLLEMRDTLSRAEITAGYQPADLAGKLNALNQRRAELTRLLGAATFDAEWNNALMRQFKEAVALLRPGNIWFEEMRRQIVDVYVKQAQQFVATDRFDAARRMLDTGESIQPGLELFAEQRAALTQAEAQFKREQEERLRLARIDALKNTLLTQANANQVTDAARSLENLRRELPAGDAFVIAEGPQAIAASYLRLANIQAERGSFGNAMSFAREGLKFAPEMQGLKDAVAQFGNLARRQELMNLAGSATTGNVRQIPGLLGEVQQLFPADATAIANEALRALAKRIKDMESSDVIGANELLDAAKQVFPNNDTLADITLRQPPRPSQYVPSGREALSKNLLSEAEKILATAQREEPGHEQVAAFAKELAKRQSDANQYFLYYQDVMRRGQKAQAKPYLDEALRLWADNEQYQQELNANFTTTRAPTRAADGSRPCTASLAGYGRTGRAVCFDMLAGDVRGPEMVVVPAGGGNSQPYAIGKYEVSIADYNAFCTAGGQCQALGGDPGMPATNITWQSMQAYAQWLSQATGASYRIPSEAEWLHAANAGNPGAVTDFNCRVTQGSQIIKGLTMLEAQSGRPNPWGLTNYVGNAQELVRAGNGVAARGGSYQDNLSNCDIQLTRSHTGAADALTGFRVARNID